MGGGALCEGMIETPVMTGVSTIDQSIKQANRRVFLPPPPSSQDARGLSIFSRFPPATQRREGPGFTAEGNKMLPVITDDPKLLSDFIKWE